MTAINYELVLEYLKVLLSWPVAASFIAILLLRNFRAEIGDWLRHLAIRRGETEVYSRQPPTSLEEISPKSRLPESLPERIEEEQPQPELSEPEPPPDAAQDMHQLEQENSRLKVLLAWQTKQAKIWEFNYLNYFLVAYTKKVLAWLSKSGPTAVGTYHSAWMQHIPLPKERETVVQALVGHSLVEERDGQIAVTAKGQEYVEWANLPALLTVPPPGLIVPKLTT